MENEKEKLADFLSKAFIGFLISVHIFIFTRLSWCFYSNFHYKDWDLAIYNQIFKGFTVLKPYTSLGGVPYLGPHAEITMALFVPLYALFPSPVTLLVLQTVFLGLAALPLFLIANTVLGRPWGVIFAGLYFLYPALGFINLNEFHPETLLPFVQFFLFYFFIKKDFPRFLIFMFLCLFAKENMPLILMALGGYALLKKREAKWALFPILSGVVWFFIYLRFIAPSLRLGRVDFYSFYSHLGATLGQIALSVITKPMLVLKTIFVPSKMLYLSHLFGPLSFLSLLCPSILLIVAPNFLQHLLSLRATETTLLYYYPSEFLAFIFIAAIFGLRRLLNVGMVNKIRRVLYFLIPAVALSYSFFIGLHAHVPRIMKESCLRTNLADFKDSFLASLPENAPIVATFDFLPKLSAKTSDLYSFHKVIEGKYSSSKDFVLPENVQYAMLDLDNIIPSYVLFRPIVPERFKAFLFGNPWGGLDVVDNIVFLRKDPPGALKLFEQVPEARGVFAHAVFDDNLELVSFEASDNGGQEGKRIFLSFYWRLLMQTGKNYWLMYLFLDSKGNVVYQKMHPLGYLFYPTSDWKADELIKEECRLSMPNLKSQEKYSLFAGILDMGSGKLCSVKLPSTQEPVYFVGLLEMTTR